MATTKKATSKSKPLDENQLISRYMQAVLESNETPKNVFSFCKQQELDETEFYAHFNSLDALRQNIWVKFFENAVDTIEKEPDFAGYSDKNKLLTLFFTLFEILTLNRSYVSFALVENKAGLKNLESLKAFRQEFKKYMEQVVISPQTGSFEKVAKATEKVYAEGAWIQFMFLLKFWLDDTSKGFEKTDILIEKSVNTVVDLADTKPLESLFDLGKFLWKEKMQ
ncbi:MAG: TetR/AcrR family transcriptional regulator [Flavobacterium sp.]|jgi:hypothetical protein|nr:TetR/AcrR family transcriptional regulator [Flavobacterium sp.]